MPLKEEKQVFEKRFQIVDNFFTVSECLHFEKKNKGKKRGKKYCPKSYK